MNRRDFLQTLLGTTVAVATLPAALFGGELNEAALRGLEFADLKDLLLWAPFEAFLPDDTNPVIEDPADGTQTGVLKAADIVKGQPLTMQFWHSHNGIYHMFTITSQHLSLLKSDHPTLIQLPTTVVEDHYHFVIIDPNKPA